MAYLSDASLGRVVGVGLGMGVAHVLSPDHLSALATLSAGGGLGAFRLGVRWGLGHSAGMVGAALGLLAVTRGGEAAYALEGGSRDAARLAERLAWLCNGLVGVTMVAIGAYGARRALRGGGGLPSHGHGHCAHDHAHRGAGGHRDRKDSRLALGVGVVHGLTHVVWVLPVLQMRALGHAAAYLAAFAVASSAAITARRAASPRGRARARALPTLPTLPARPAVPARATRGPRRSRTSTSWTCRSR